MAKNLTQEDFNSHAHVERDTNVLTFSFFVKYFNSHAHVERDILGGFSLLVLFKISTHTLTWSVTSAKDLSEKNTGISTHTLTWSVTLRNYVINPVYRISTHTLTWSVTYQLFADVF